MSAMPALVIGSPDDAVIAALPLWVAVLVGSIVPPHFG